MYVCITYTPRTYVRTYVSIPVRVPEDYTYNRPTQRMPMGTSNQFMTYIGSYDVVVRLVTCSPQPRVLSVEKDDGSQTGTLVRHQCVSALRDLSHVSLLPLLSP